MRKAVAHQHGAQAELHHQQKMLERCWIPVAIKGWLDDPFEHCEGVKPFLPNWTKGDANDCTKFAVDIQWLKVLSKGTDENTKHDQRHSLAGVGGQSLPKINFREV